MQVLSMMFWAITRVGLVFILGICVLIDAKRTAASEAEHGNQNGDAQHD